jgi:hypothetical protein
VVFSELTANGSAYVAETTELTLTFDRAIEGGLVLDNITLNGGGAGAAAYSLSGSGVSYTLYVTGITAEGDVSVIVNKQGFTFEPPVKTVTVHRQGTPVTMTAEQTGGSDSPGASATTTYLKLTFNTDIDGLNKNEITLTSLVPGNNSISAGDPQWGGTWYTVPVSGIDKSGQINVSVNKSGYSIRAKTVYVYYADKVAFTGVEVDGQAETTPTTKLTLTFDKDIAGLNEYDITLSNSGLQKGVLSKVPETTGHYALPVTVTTAETLTVTVAGKSGYIISPVFDQTLVHTGNVTLSKVEANGGTNATTTQLTLTFDKAIAGLTAGDITLSGDAAAGVTKTTLSASEGNTKWKLGLDNVTRSGNISVSVSKTGYVISSSPKSAAVSYIVPVTLYSVTPDGGTNATTTQLTLAFDKDITGLTAGDITLSSYNNNKGTLGKTGTGTYILPVSGITSTGSVTVNSVSKSGYSITGAPREVPVFVASGAAPGTSASPGTPEYLDYVKTYFMGTGGTTKIIDNTDGTYDEVHIFTSTDTGQYLTFMRKPRTGTVEVLVVGGGGGSGLGASGPNRWGRSGGAGGYIYLNNFDVTVSPYFVVTVGAGGAYSAGTGTYSQIASPNGIYYIKANGGTGGSYIGGAGVGGSCGSVEVALKSGSSTIPGYQGFAGGENSGGAGAGGNGQGDTGELGVESSISGEAKAYAAGGYYGASANTGNGAKGGYAGSYGSAGSSGIVIVRWRWDP